MYIEIADRKEGWSNIEYAQKLIPSIWEDAYNIDLCKPALRMGVIGTLNEQCHVHVIDKNLFLVVFCFNLFDPDQKRCTRDGVMGVADLSQVKKAMKDVLLEAYSFLGKSPFQKIVEEKLNEDYVRISHN